MPAINLKLTLDEVNIILEALGQQPYVKVSQLIGNIQQQATAQLERATGEEEDQRALGGGAGHGSGQ